MKTLVIALFSSIALAASALAHGNVEIGPNGGRLIEIGALGEHADLHAEVVLKDGQFVISLYDEKTKKEIPVTEQQLTITHRETKQKLTPELKEGKWVVAKPDGNNFWLIIQFKENAQAKPRNTRLHFDASNCSGCSQAEWLCKCS